MENFDVEKWLLIIQQGDRAPDVVMGWVFGIILTTCALAAMIYLVFGRPEEYSKTFSNVSATAIAAFTIAMWCLILSSHSKGEYYSIAIAEIVQHPDKEKILKDPTVRVMYDSITSYVLKQANLEYYNRKIDEKLRRY